LNIVLEKLSSSKFPATISWHNRELYIKGLDEALEDYELVRITTVKRCGCCREEFEDGEFAYYVIIDNDIICSKCKEKVNAKLEPRVFRK
ncbi:MAG: hypothetical protein JXQ26_05420, partial [Tissierellales bacterium]|nr:hypothetical protein [Tissierellales bacterium]